MNTIRTCLLLAGFLAVGACSEGSAKKKTEPPPVPVTATQAVAKDIPVRLQVVGRAEAYESVALKSRVDGQVEAVLFAEGQHVNQGDLLIRMDPADLAARLSQAQATAGRDEALLAKARADTTRYLALKDRSFVSDEKVNDVRTNEAAAQANLRASKAAVDVARLQRSYTEIRAPISGVIGARLVFPGSSVKTNDTTLAVIDRKDVRLTLHDQRLSCSRLVLFGIDEAELVHPPQYILLPQACALRVDDRIEGRGRFGQACQHRSFGDGQFLE